MNTESVESNNKIGVQTLCVCAYFICMPLTFITVISGVSMLKLMTVPIVALLGGALFLGKSRIAFNGVHLTYCLYMLLSLLSLAILKSDESTTTVRDMALSFTVMLLATLCVYNSREKRFIENSWLIVGAVSALLCIMSKSTIYGQRTVIVIMGSREDPNQFCAYFILPALYAIERLTKTKSPWRFLFLPYLGMIIYAILRTGSRGGLVGVAVGIVAFFFLGIRSFKAKIAILLSSVLIVAVSVSVVVPLLPQSVRERYTLERIAGDKGSGRYEIWAFLVSYITNDDDALVTGYGICSTVDVMKKAYFENSYAHNQWIQVLFDQGILGVLFYALLIFACFARTWRKNPVCACALVSIMAFSMSLTFYTFKPYLNIIMMCALNYENEFNPLFARFSDSDFGKGLINA